MIIVAILLSQANSLSIINAVISIIGIVCLHIFGNLYNDYFDVKSGTDEANNEYFNSGGLPNLLKKVPPLTGER